MPETPQVCHSATLCDKWNLVRRRSGSRCRTGRSAREPIPFLYADVFHWNMSLVSQLWKPARSFCTSYVEGDRGTSYKELLDDVDDTLVPLRSKARAAIFKTPAHVPHPDAHIPPAPPLRRFPALWDSIVRRFGRYINGSSRAFVRMRGLGRAHHPG